MATLTELKKAMAAVAVQAKEAGLELPPEAEKLIAELESEVANQMMQVALDGEKAAWAEFIAERPPVVHNMLAKGLTIMVSKQGDLLSITHRIVKARTGSTGERGPRGVLPAEGTSAVKKSYKGKGYRAEIKGGKVAVYTADGTLLGEAASLSKAAAIVTGTTTAPGPTFWGEFA